MSKISYKYNFQYYGMDIPFKVGEFLKRNTIEDFLQPLDKHDKTLDDDIYGAKIISIYNADMGCIESIEVSEMMIKIQLVDGTKLQLDTEESAGTIFDPFYKALKDDFLTIELEFTRDLESALAEQVQKLNSTPIPPDSDNEDLSMLRAEIIELDGYIAGLAFSTIGDKGFNSIINYDQTLREKIEKFVSNSATSELASKYLEYLILLEEIIGELDHNRSLRV